MYIDEYVMKMDKASIGFLVKITIEPDNDGYHAYCSNLKGLHTSGATKEEALSNAKDAVEAYLKSLVKHGDPIPIGIVVKEQSDDNHKSGRSHHIEEFKVACTI